MSDTDEVEPRLFFLAQKCVDCPRALFDFGKDEEDLGDWVRTTEVLANFDHAVSNGKEYVFYDGSLHSLGANDEELWDGTVPDEVLLAEIESYTVKPARFLDLSDKRDNLPVEAFL